MKKILISTSIIFLSLLINSSYGASKLNEKFSIDKLIGYQARIIIQSEQDQKARNLTPKEKNDIKNKEQSEILNWKTTLENRTRLER